jgi:hypothetical protein
MITMGLTGVMSLMGWTFITVGVERHNGAFTTLHWHTYKLKVNANNSLV